VRCAVLSDPGLSGRLSDSDFAVRHNNKAS
jgi:hypothetical protein